MPRIPRPHPFFLFLGVIALTAGACGGDSNTDAGPFGTDIDDSPADSDTDTDDTPADSSTDTDDTPADSSTDTDDTPEGVDRSAELIGRWDIINYGLPDEGSITNVVGSEPVFIEFAADGSISYHTGCNSGGGPYTTSDVYLVPESALDDIPEGQPITLGPGLAQTEIGCEGFLGEQDVDLPARFSEATRFRIDGNTMLLLDEFLLVEAVRAG